MRTRAVQHWGEPCPEGEAPALTRLENRLTPSLLARAAPPPRPGKDAAGAMTWVGDAHRAGGGPAVEPRDPPSPCRAAPELPVEPREFPSLSGQADAPDAGWAPQTWARALLGGVGGLALLVGTAPVAPPPPAVVARELPSPGAGPARESVSPASEALRPGASLPTRVRGAVDGVVTREAADGPWTSRDGNCLDLAAKWQQRLAAAGLPARIGVVDAGSQAVALSVDGRAVPGKFHAFVVIEGGEAPLLVDPSVQQFFGGAQARPDLPSVFVGTVEDAVELFARHRRDLRLEVEGDLHEGRYTPRDLADLVYGAGPHASLRQVL